MSKHVMISRVENDKVLVLERVFDAPREFVFKLFKEPEYLKRWWGTHGWELPVCNIDFRPGGVWHYCMKCVDQNQDEYGMESWNKTIYKEIVEPEKIVYTDYFSDEDGNINEAMPAPEVTMEFLDLGGETKLVSRSVFDSEESLQAVLDMGLLEGITQTWDRLNELVETLKKN
ncbi:MULTISPECIES: SRPBCC domain-containing protein [Paenibacillus]|uniref:Activator of Hsp90 ATPase 1 family protein n=2 Tax=Paenibacillus lactis TaxID=228574 RepID=G4HJR0_9BACL|nr:SRPBCC domain-containing protein [Paenibacillus lactis]EHB62514.1 Activator of Hsp90 ATPase 1 family protein [Paenibacillus lactis 154]MBP1895950.1 uncharacterized protein YndB with AHSA1/START domain [Paenibacillus lactis]GIO90305.1 activator of HSP90 ATPase [Paenibacillus lactis]